MFTNIFAGIAGGLAYSLSGVANKDKLEDFDWKKLTPTVIVAGIVGGFSGYLGQDYSVLATGTFATGITVIVEKLFKAFVKKVLKK